MIKLEYCHSDITDYLEYYSIHEWNTTKLIWQCHDETYTLGRIDLDYTGI